MAAEIDHAFGLSAAPRGFDRAKLLKQINADLRKKDSQKLADIKAAVAAVKKRREQAMRKQVQRKARQACQVRKAAIRSAALGLEERQQQRLKAERQLQQELRRSEQTAKQRKAEFKKTSAEALAESDDRVRFNIHPELVGVFNKVRKSIKPGHHKSRTEAFLEWVEENPDDVIAIQQASADLELERLLKEQARVGRKAGRGARGRKRGALGEHLEGVPF